MKNISITAVLMAFLFTFTIAAPLTLISTDADAKGFRSSSSFSRSSSYKSSSKPSFKSYSKKSTSSTKQKAISTKTASSTSSKTASKAPKGTKAVATPTNRRAGKAALSSQRSQFKKPVTSSKVTPSQSRATYSKKYSSNPVYKRASSYDSSTYYSRRNSYYNSYYAPGYVYGGSPSYGLWDTLFLYSMLSNMNNASSFGYHHRNDPGYTEWRREANEQARTNAELKAQLTAMDTKIASMNGPRSDDYLPEGVDADIALANEALESQKPIMRVCTGATNGAYYKITTNILATSVGNAHIMAVPTAGSGENLAKLASGDCDAALVQGDSYWNYVEQYQTSNLPFERVSSLMKETVHMICHADGPSELSDLTKSNTVLFPRGSGAAETWANIIEEDSDYRQVNTSSDITSYEQAIMQVKENKNTCALFVGVAGATQLVKNFEKIAVEENLVLVDMIDLGVLTATDPSGKTVYQATSVDTSVYPNLLRQNYCLGYCSGDNDTIQLDADFIVGTKWKESNPTKYDQFAVELMGLKSDINRSIVAAQ